MYMSALRFWSEEPLLTFLNLTLELSTCPENSGTITTFSDHFNYQPHGPSPFPLALGAKYTKQLTGLQFAR
jgi:hypothetical protein